MDRLAARFTFILLPLWCGFLIAESKDPTSDDVQLIVPDLVKEGARVPMYCKFHVENNTSVDTVKWYKGQLEFFRYSTKEHPQMKQISLKEIEIDRSSSGMKNLTIRSAPVKLTGKIVCEVTFDLTFHAVRKEKWIVVTVPPENNPVIQTTFSDPSQSGKLGNSMSSSGSNSKTSFDNFHVGPVELGKTMTVNCTSGPSKPATNLTFEINGSPAEDYNAIVVQSEEDYMSIYSTNFSTSEARTRTALMTVLLEQQHFKDRKIRVKCKSTLFNLQTAFSDEFIGELPPEKTGTASGYGFGKNGETRRESGKLVWSITTIVVGKLVLFSLKSFL